MSAHGLGRSPHLEQCLARAGRRSAICVTVASVETIFGDIFVVVDILGCIIGYDDKKMSEKVTGWVYFYVKLNFKEGLL